MTKKKTKKWLRKLQREEQEMNEKRVEAEINSPTHRESTPPQNPTPMFSDKLLRELTRQIVSDVVKEYGTPLHKATMSTPNIPAANRSTRNPTFTEVVGDLKMPSRSDSEDDEGFRPVTTRHRSSRSHDLDNSSNSSISASDISSKESRSDYQSSSEEDGQGKGRNTQSAAARLLHDIKSMDKQTRRASYVHSLAIDSKKSKKDKNLIIFQQPPKYDHIMLESFSIRKIFSFIDQVYEYQSRNGISLPVAALLSEKVRGQLLAHHPTISINQFYELEVSKIFRYLLKEVRPKTKLAFIDCLERHVSFELPHNYRPSASDFKPFYDALLLYRKNFERVFDAISFHNENNIPLVENKDGGLIKVFLDKIKFDYGKNLFKLFPKKKFKSIDDFLNTFYLEVEQDFKRYKRARETNSHFGGTEYVSRSHSSKPVQLTKPHAYPHKKKFTHGKLNAILGDQDEDESNNDMRDNHEHEKAIDAFDLNSSIVEPTQVSTYQSEGESSDERDEDNYDQKGEAADTNVEVSDEETRAEESLTQQLQQELAYVTNQANSANNSKPSDVPNGCFQLLLYGKCAKAPPSKCSYSHDPKILVRTHYYITKLLQNSKYKPSNVIRKPPSSLGHISLDYYPDRHREMQGVMHNLFLSSMPEANLLSSVHRQGYFDTDSGELLTVPKVLFDTGALHSNYVSKRFVDLNHEVLSPYLQECSGVVTLADNKTKASIDQLLRIPTVFIGDNGCNHRAVIDFCVFDMSSNDAIIGLPSIIMHFNVLFKDMIDQGVRSLHPEPNLFSVDTTVYPWTKPIALEAPEDVDTAIPCSFPEPLHFMEMTTDEAIKEFLSLIPTHVDPKFSAATPVIKLLETKGVKVFVPQNWKGVSGVAPLKLKFREGMPQSMKPRARPINPKLYQHAHKEFQRLLKYFYVTSDSPIASCLVIAPKATPPFIRFCGDYVLINRWIITGHYPIPDVGKHLEKISLFTIFVDLDWTNSFHQFLLDQETSEKLSVQTPWGQVRPLFLPEGVPPASGFLQSMVDEIFGDFSDWCIAIFDNLLVLAHDYDDAYRKLEIVLDRCIERNVYLKFSKSWLGFDHAKFFGYICKRGKYELSQDRKDALKAVAFPSSIKKMQSFLGAALFFKNFIPHYSTLVAPLNDMTKQSFNWDQSTWTVDYYSIFEEVKDALQSATAIYYPNYELDWILRTDASQSGVGAVLLQVVPSSDANSDVFQYQPISFASQKFSPQAVNWSTIEQEAYGIYFGVKSFSYYLRCKPFTLETDHNNLLWMEASAVPKVIRWRVYLQSFSFTLRHIPGKQNIVADWLSRAHTNADDVHTLSSSSLDSLLFILSGRIYEIHSNNYVQRSLLEPPFQSFQLHAMSKTMKSSTQVVNTDKATEDLQHRVLPIPDHTIQPEEVLKLVHGKRMGHFGIRKTWKLLNEHFPGHHIPYKVVEEFVMTCPICQKDRLGMADTLEPVVLTLKPERRRSMVGVDTLTITPPDEVGNSYATVVINHFTKLVGIYPSKTHDATSTATALFQYFCTYGLIDSIVTDPGSEFMNEVVKQLMEWFGIRHRFSLVDRHESNGVEHTNGMILRHLKALIFDERIQHKWSHPTVLPLIQFMLNSFDNSETGVIPFQAHFGSADATYFQLPALKSKDEGENDLLLTQQYMILLDKNLKTLHEISKKHQDTIAADRKKHSSPNYQNTYQPGDLVLWQRDPNIPLPTKLSPKFVGPYEVISQNRNDVTCRHIVLGHTKVFHVSRLKIFHGSIEEARRVAMIDNDQFTITDFKAYRGNPMLRTSMEFEVSFEDGSLVWLPWSKDLFETVQYESYCRSRPELYPLIFEAKTSAKRISELNRTPISEVKPGDVVLVNLRCYGAGWYETLSLDDKDHVNYLVEYRYSKWKSARHLKIEALCPLFKETFTVDHAFVKFYGSWNENDWIDSSLKFTIIDKDLIAKVPELLPSYKPIQLQNNK